MSNRKLTRIQFFAIKRELQSTHRRQEDIAADYSVGTSTVSRINRSVTWENYCAGKIATKPLRRPVSAKDPVVRKEKAHKADMRPHDRTDRATDKLAKDLDSAKTTISRSEFDSEMKSFESRQRILLTRTRNAESTNHVLAVHVALLWIAFLAILVIAIWALVRSYGGN